MDRDIPKMPDPNSEIRRSIDALKPSGVIDETPRGRLCGVDTDTYLVYQEMYALLAGTIHAINREVYEQRLTDLAITLSDLHRRGERAYEDIMTFHRPRGVA